MNLLQVKHRINLKLTYSGSDSPKYCPNKKHFNDYKKLVDYKYNSKGFRDEEWPLAIENKIWCVGDSFTVGIGQPYEEIWPKILEKQLGERCINISEDGCSNDLMSLRIKQIKTFNPKCIIVMWSYFWRRWTDCRNVHFHEVHKVHEKELPKHDLANFVKNLKSTNNNSSCKIFNYVIPNYMIEGAPIWKQLLGIKDKKNINKLINYHNPDNQFPIVNEIEQIDYARDGHHFDVLTCEKIVEDILTKY